jgi:Ca2+-binding RTX toxin-like protein
MTGGAGDDFMDGGLDVDTADYSSAASGVRVNLSIIGQQNTGGAGRDTIVNVENITGSNFNDLLVGNAGDNFILAGLGNDIVRGGGGNDTLISGLDARGDLLDGGSGLDSLQGGLGNDIIFGGTGNDFLNGFVGRDIMAGGAGADKFIFNSAPDSSLDTPDWIADFTVSEDKIVTGFASVVQISGPVFAQTVLLDFTADGVADSAILVTANATLTASDFSTSIFGV